MKPGRGLLADRKHSPRVAFLASINGFVSCCSVYIKPKATLVGIRTFAMAVCFLRRRSAKPIGTTRLPTELATKIKLAAAEHSTCPDLYILGQTRCSPSAGRRKTNNGVLEITSVSRFRAEPAELDSCQRKMLTYVHLEEPLINTSRLEEPLINTMLPLQFSC